MTAPDKTARAMTARCLPLCMAPEGRPMTDKEILRVLEAVRAMKPKGTPRLHFEMTPRLKNSPHWIAEHCSPPGVESQYHHSFRGTGTTADEAVMALYEEVRASARAKIEEAARLLTAGDLDTAPLAGRAT